MRIRLKYLLGKGMVPFGILSIFLYFKKGLDYAFPFIMLFIGFTVTYFLVSALINEKDPNKNSIKQIK